MLPRTAHSIWDGASSSIACRPWRSSLLSESVSFLCITILPSLKRFSGYWERLVGFLWPISFPPFALIKDWQLSYSTWYSHLLSYQRVCFSPSPIKMSFSISWDHLRGKWKRTNLYLILILNQVVRRLLWAYGFIHFSKTSLLERDCQSYFKMQKLRLRKVKKLIKDQGNYKLQSQNSILGIFNFTNHFYKIEWGH